MFSFNNKKPLEELFVDTEGSRDITPEDILSDSSFGSIASFEQPDTALEVPVGLLSIRFFFAAAFLVLLGLGGYVVYLAVDKGAQNALIAQTNAQQAYEVGFSRGDIVASDGTVLAASTPAFHLIANPSLFENQEAIVKASHAIAEHYPQASAERIANKLLAAYTRNLGHLILLKNLDEQTVAELSPVMEQYKALSLQETAIRFYPTGAEFAHVIGYTATVSEEELADSPAYSYSDQTGKQGIEKQFEDELRGKESVFVKFVGIGGSVEEERVIQEAEPGARLTLTVDPALQKASREVLAQYLQENNITNGAVVALDPRSGAVRALVSLPDFDPNDFSRGLTQEQAKKYFESTQRPLFNRAVAGVYPTGSIIKPLVAVAALEEHIIDPLKTILTHGYITVQSVFDPSVSWTFLDWKNHGVVDMRRAIAVSSNVYFYTIGGGYQGQAGLGIDRLASWLGRFQWGHKLDIDFDVENSGHVPTPEWKKEAKGEEWYIGDTYNTSIGQGDIQVSPLQVAAAIVPFANGGTIYKPYVVQRIDRADGTSRLYFPDPIVQQVASPASIEVAREGMRMAVQEGSSQFLKQLPITFAGKTGTAEIGDGQNHAWFAGFGPFEDPNIVIVVLLERGEGSTAAVHAAHDILQRWLAQDTPQDEAGNAGE